MTDIDRRSFLARTTGAAAAATTGCLCSCGCSRMESAPAATTEAVEVEDKGVRVAVAKVPELAKVGGSATVKHDALPETVLVARTDDKTYVAASTRCTHFGMPVSYVHEAKQFRCCSLGHSTYKLDGTIVSGPAKRPLKIYPTRLDGEILVVDKG